MYIANQNLMSHITGEMGKQHNVLVSISCNIGFYLVGETIVWGRDCYTPPDGYIGCREEQRHEKPAQVCYCDGDLCNAKMEDISTTSTTTTPNGKIYQIKQ